MRKLSDEYGIEVRVSHMFGSTGEPLLARDVLDSARAAQIRRDLSPRALDRTFKGFSWRRRSFRLGPPRLPRVSEGSSTEDNTVSAEPSAAPGC